MLSSVSLVARARGQVKTCTAQCFIRLLIFGSKRLISFICIVVVVISINIELLYFIIYMSKHLLGYDLSSVLTSKNEEFGNSLKKLACWNFKHE